jgi:type I restriction enzyme, S subunit
LNIYPVESLGDVCEIAAGGTPLRSVAEYFDGDIPWVKIGDLAQGTVISTEERITRRGLEGSAAKLFPAGTVLVSIFATIGRTAVLGIDAATNQAIAGITPRDPGKLDSVYLRHYFDSITASLVKAARGVAQLNINLGILKALPFPLPPLAEQRRIAAILDQADALRAKRREALAELDSLTQSIFIEMFGDPASNPKGWPDKGLGDAIQLLQYGPRFYDEAYSTDGIRIARITDLSEAGELDFDSMPRMAVTQRNLTQFSLEPGDMIFARTGATVGKVAVYREGDPPCIPGAYFIRLKFRSDLMPDYCAAVLRSSSVREMVTVQSRQAAQQNFSGPGLRRLPMPVPPLALQRSFATRIQAVESLKATNRTALAESDALFASLQHRAFTGQL